MCFRLGFNHGFLSSLSVILVSELGDKTFFIAAIMAMSYSRLIVFSGALLALAVMTALSVFMGAITAIIPRYITYYVSTGLFGETTNFKLHFHADFSTFWTENAERRL